MVIFSKQSQIQQIVIKETRSFHLKVIERIFSKIMQLRGLCNYSEFRLITGLSYIHINREAATQAHFNVLIGFTISLSPWMYYCCCSSLLVLYSHLLSAIVLYRKIVVCPVNLRVLIVIVQPWFKFDGRDFFG
jgi:hypothetical protein